MPAARGKRDRLLEVRTRRGVRPLSNEDEYLKGILKYVTRIEAHPVSYLDSWNLLEHTNRHSFKRSIQGLCEHIKKTMATPRDSVDQRNW